MTPYELGLFVSVYSENMKQRQEGEITLAYLGVYWNRIKKMPTLKSVLGQEEREKKQTPESMLQEIIKINAANGGTTY